MSEQPLRVLLALDDASLRELFAQYLHECRYMVDRAATGDELLARIAGAQGQYDVIVLDDRLRPARDCGLQSLGIQLVAEIKARYPSIAFIVFAQGELNSELEALRAGAHRYIRRPLDPEELGMLIANAAEHQRLKGVAREKQILERLLETSAALLGERDLPDRLNTICRAAFELFDVDHSGLVLFDPSYECGRVVAEYPALGTLGISIPICGVLAEEQLINTKQPLVIPDAANDPTLGPVQDILRRHDIRSILIVPVVFKGRLLGSFSLDAIGRLRDFTTEELDLCKIFAGQAAAAVENAQLFDATKRHADQLETVRQTTLAITSQLERDTLLGTIIEQAVGLLGANSGGIYEYMPERNELSLIADYGRPENLLGETLQIGEGMAGRLVQTGDPFMIVDDYNRWPGRASIYADGRPFGAVIEVPLKWQERTIGVLYVDDAVGRTFTPQDADLLGLFADHAAIALINVGFATRLREQKDNLARLIDGSPNGVIGIDLRGQITIFSHQAEATLKYRAEEVLGKHVDLLYANLEEPRRVGRLLHTAPDGQVVNYETVFRDKEETSIPVRLTATWLRDTHGEHIGSVGYFEDLRSITETRRRLELMLKATSIVAEAKSLADAVQSLAEMMVVFLNITFCRIFLLDESKQYLVAKAVAPIPRTASSLDWRPGLGDRTAVSKWPGLAEQLRTGGPTVLRMRSRRSRAVLLTWSRLLHLEPDIQSLYLIPLRTSNGVVGLLDLGELRHWERAPFSNEKQTLASAIAEQTAVLIERIRLYEIAERRQRLLTALDEASRHIRAEKEPAKLLQEIVRLATELVDCSAGGLAINRPNLAELELSATYALPKALVGRRQSHREGMIGYVACTGQSTVDSDYDHRIDRDPMLEPYGFKTVIGIPLRQAGYVEAVLFVADDKSARSFSNVDLEILERFAAQAELALETSRLLSHEERMFAQLAILHRISDYIQAAGDLNKILHVLLTGVTAVYGLRFNRAALLLLDETRSALVGQTGIGNLSEAQARAAWAADHQRGLSDFERYLKLLEQQALPSTPIGDRIRGLYLPIDAAGADTFSQVVLTQDWLLGSADEVVGLPEAFVTAFEPAQPLVVVPLVAREQVIGLLVADNKFTQAPITHADIESLLTFANTAAVAIDNTQLLRETAAAHERLRSFYEASNTLVSSADTEQVLRDMVERARLAVDASDVSVILIDELGRPRNLITAGMDQPADISDVIRPAGLSMQVMHTGVPVIISNINAQRDHVNPSMIERGVAAALCMPLLLEGRRIGVMWFHYARPHYFSNTEVEAVQLYVNQAAIAYDSARRIEELSKARNVARVVAEVTVLEDVRSTLHAVAEGTRDALHCDTVTMYMYDQSKDRLSHPPIMIDVWHPKRAARLVNVPPASIVFKMVKRDRLYIVDDVASDPLFRDTRFAKDEQVASCVAIPLKVGAETVGVMFVNYRSRHRFAGDELINIELFANQAAVAIRNAQLYEQMHKRASALAALSEAGQTVSGSLDLNEILQQIAEQAWKLTSYGNKRISFANIRLVRGQKAWLVAAYPKKWLARAVSVMGEAVDLWDDHGGKIGITGRTIKCGVPQLVNDVSADPDYVSIDRKTKSELAVPIMIDGAVIGVINVEHSDAYAFDSEDQRALAALAAQAAIAIRNAQLYERAQRRALVLQTLYEAGQVVISNFSLPGTLYQIVERACKLMEIRGRPAHFSHLSLLKGDKLKFTTAYPHDLLRGMREQIGHQIDLQQDGRVGVTGRVVRTGCSQRVGDVQVDADYIAYNSETRSELAVPIKIGSEVIGVINVEHAEPDAFDKDHQHDLEALAAQAALTIFNAQLYEDAQQRAEALQMLYEAGQAVTSSLDLQETLNRLVEQACRLTGARAKQITFASIRVVEGDTATLVATYPPEYLAAARAAARDRVALRDGTSDRIGIMGRAIMESTPQLVGDVTNDPDYLQWHPETRAELTLPIKIGDEVIGVINVEHPEPHTFDRDDQQVLEALAAQAAIAIRNARLHEETRRQLRELEKTREMLAARTAVAWTGMLSSTWRHAIDGHAMVIAEEIDMLRSTLPVKAQTARIQEKLAKIERVAREILATPLTPPLYDEEGGMSVSVKDLLRERLRQLRENESYKYRYVKCEFSSTVDDMVTVRISPEWLRRAFDILIDNAIEAASKSSAKLVMVRIHRDDPWLVISIRDSGSGIPDAVRFRLFGEPIPKSKGDRGLGMGLLMAQMILQAYSGEIQIGTSGPEGTTMVIRLPLEV